MSTGSGPLRIGLIGNGLATSLSPLIHEEEARALGLSGYSYERLDLSGIAAVDLAEVLKEALHEGFTGFNVTYPHKQAILPCLDSIAPDAAVLGAVNTIVVSEAGLTGYNTDRSGFLAGLRRVLPAGTRHQTAALFGAGGAGSAVAAALLDFGVQNLRIIDPVPERREQLKAALQLAYPARSGTSIQAGGEELAHEWVSTANGVVNATPIGMEHIPGTPFDTAWLRPGHWVADVVYRPVRTALLAEASQLGCPVVDGTTMLVEQAADTFALLTGIEPVRTRMRSHLARLLAPAVR
ncbi:shikimate dehydrogenase [Arthrobacter caoxuetaonis]|uniref:shikimate dehydrogenase n=1 Tax=Arthrobacter caoxuetaonis TaxID=2886935 RepID=UPI001D13D4F1|nr:shikimate dehydrogenase [Arthrobacter caoxuetaonis]